MTRPLLAFIAISALLVTAVPVQAAAPTTMTANPGTTPQSTTVNTAFINALAVTVKDAGNNPVSGVSVTFGSPPVGASAIFSNATHTITVATNASGVAAASLTANATSGGPYNATATATGLSSVNFTLTNAAGAAASMTANVTTTPQATTVNTAFTHALAVTLMDALSNPVPGITVTFTAPGNGASGVFSNSTTTISVITNASGVASAPFTANAKAGGPYTVSATASGLTGVNFSLTNNPSAPTSMTANPGTSPQSTPVNTAFANALGVTIKDASSNPIAGKNVVFTAPNSGASGIFANSTTTITIATNASGMASAPITANATVAAIYNVTASTTGLVNVNFSLTNTAAAPATIAPTSGTTPQSTLVNTTFGHALGVLVNDIVGNPVPGTSVIFKAPGNGASGLFSNATTTITIVTNASGIAAAPFTANSVACGYVVKASTASLTTGFALTNQANANDDIVFCNGFE